MKHKLLFPILWAALFIHSWTLASAQTPKTTTAEKVVKLVCEESPPFNYAENGATIGIASDIIRESYKRMGYQVVFQQYPWARALAMAEEGMSDGIFCLYKTAEREKSFVYSDKIASDTQSFFVLKDSKIHFNGRLQEMGSYSIGVTRDYSYGEAFDEAVKTGVLAHIEAVSGIENNIEKLLIKRIDLFIEGEYLGLSKLKAMSLLDQVRVLDVKVNEPGLYVGFSKKRNAASFAEAFNNGLAIIRKDGTYSKIINRYIQK